MSFIVSNWFFSRGWGVGDAQSNCAEIRLFVGDLQKTAFISSFHSPEMCVNYAHEALGFFWKCLFCFTSAF